MSIRAAASRLAGVLAVAGLLTTALEGQEGAGGSPTADPTITADALSGLVQQWETDPSRAPQATPVLARLERLQTLARRWLVRLPTRERLIALTPDGRILGVVEGDARRVVVGASFDAPLRQAGARIVLVHNHPSGTSLSGADLEQLTKPGVDAIIAIGHDGSVYGATRGERFDALQFDAITYPLAHRQVGGQLRIEQYSSRLREVLTDHYGHIVALSLHKAGVIRYRGLLEHIRALTFAECVILCGRITEAVAARVRSVRAPAPLH